MSDGTFVGLESTPEETELKIYLTEDADLHIQGETDSFSRPLAPPETLPVKCLYMGAVSAQDTRYGTQEIPKFKLRMEKRSKKFVIGADQITYPATTIEPTVDAQQLDDPETKTYTVRGIDTRKTHVAGIWDVILG